MNARRFATIAGHELRTQLTGPLFWVLLLLLLFVSSALNPVAMIPSGDDPVGGVRAHANSPHALAQWFAIGSFLAYTFFAALLAGLSVIRDDESGIGELLRSTPLSPAEYLLGKFAGVSATLGIALIGQVMFTMFFREGAANAGGPGTDHGTFRLGSYLLAATWFAVPGVAYTAAVAFYVGARTRRPLAVYGVPIVLFAYTILVSWNFTPAGIDPRLDRALMILDPMAIRWLDRSVFAVDRGVTFYNTAPISFDATFVWNRLLTLGLAAVAVLATLRPVRAREWKWSAVRDGAVGVARGRSPWEGAEPQAIERDEPLRELAMSNRPPSLVAGARTIVRAELGEWFRRPALYFFAAFLCLVVVEVAGTEADVFGAPVLLTAGGLAVRAIPAVTILICLFLLFAIVESMHRDAVSGFDPILHASPVSTDALLLGRVLASGAIIAFLSGVCGVAGLLLLLGQRGGPVEIWPLVLVFGPVLGPTFLLWAAFVVAIMVILRSRAAALAAGLSALVATGALFATGSMTWASNWPLWGALRWTDLGTFPLNGSALWWNRAAALAGSACFLAVARTCLIRTERDAAATVARFRSGRFAKEALRLSPFLLLLLLVEGYLALGVHRGFQGGPAEERARELWRRNVATWRDVAPPEITRIDLELELEPFGRRLTVRGAYDLIHATDDRMRWLPFTVGGDSARFAWKVNGVPVPVDDLGGLDLLPLDRPLERGERVRVEFSRSAAAPQGFTKNGGGVGSFVLPAGVLLATRGSDFLPLPGFVESDGPEAKGRPAPARLPDGSVPRAPGAPARRKAPFAVRVEVSAPSEFTVVSVGVKTAEWSAAGRTHVVWESDHPVDALNVVAGRWDVRRSGDNAVFFHPRHDANVESILRTLDAARRRYSEWFHPYPWKELRLCEVPDLTTEATSFPTNISFSEGIGFLSAGDSRSGLASSVTAHEVAHQWWGHLLSASEGPGSDLLIEGMANYSALLLHESEHGIASRIEFARQLERIYLERRRAAEERPLLATIPRSSSDEAVLSFRGGWVLWMLHNEMGRDPMLSGLRALIESHVASRMEATPEDLVAALRARAPDRSAFDCFAEQWLDGVVLPEYQISDATAERTPAGWRVAAAVRNVGTGTAVVTVEARGKGVDHRARRSLRVDPGRAVPVEWTLDFRPERIVIDPEALVLQLHRDRAVAELSPSGPRER